MTRRTFITALFGTVAASAVVKGQVKKGVSLKEAIDRLTIKIPRMRPGNIIAMGKQENPHAISRAYARAMGIR